MQPDPAGNIPLYSYSLSGLVLDPRHNELLCSYSWDVGSLTRRCATPGGSSTCIPGCSRYEHDTNPWCDPGSDEWQWRDPPCAWRPEDLEAMLRAREEVRHRQMKPPHKHWNDHKFYNELIFKTEAYSRHLPESILAVFYIHDDTCADAFAGPKCEEYGTHARNTIAAQFGLSPSRLPLLKLDLWDWGEPFQDVTPEHVGSDLHPAALEQGQLPLGCSHPLCGALLGWVMPRPADYKFFSMWNLGFQRRQPHSVGCWEWPENGGSRPDHFFRDVLEGVRCNRNWLDGAYGGSADRPFSSPSPALLGFDESINEFCSRLDGDDPWDQEDTNRKIATRCRKAHRNVLRVLTGGWSMCANLEWQMCALTGKLPGQGSRSISFATAPRDLELSWWSDPSSHPTYPCKGWTIGSRCDPDGFTVGVSAAAGFPTCDIKRPCNHSRFPFLPRTALMQALLPSHPRTCSLRKWR